MMGSNYRLTHWCSTWWRGEANKHNTCPSQVPTQPPLHPYKNTKQNKNKKTETSVVFTQFSSSQVPSIKLLSPSLSPLTSPHMGINLLEALNVRQVGNGDKFLVLAHGFGTDQSAWNRILSSFTPNYRVILYDLVCAGSVNPDYFDFRRYTSLDAYVEDLLNILDTLGVQKCAYVGHSVSAMIGILASIRRPNLFTKLVLIGGSPRFLNDIDYYGGFERGEIEKVFTAMESNYEAWVNGFAPLAVGADVPAAVREFSRTLFNMRPDISLFVCRTVFNSDLRGYLGFVKVPCVIIQSAKDNSVPVKVATYLKTHLGGRNTVEILHTEGHLPHLSAPALLVQVLKRALAR